MQPFHETVNVDLGTKYSSQIKKKITFCAASGPSVIRLSNLETAKYN